MPKADPAADAAAATEARLERLREPLLTALEAGVKALTDIRKGRASLAVLLMFDDKTHQIVGARLHMVDLADGAGGRPIHFGTAPPADGAALD